MLNIVKWNGTKKTKLVPKVQGRIMKQRIVTETIHQIQTKGFTFTISDLAKQLAVSKRTIYEHFSSKDEIVDEVIRNVIESIQEKEKISLKMIRYKQLKK